MCNTVKFTALGFLFFLFYDALSLRVIPERAGIVFINESYATNVFLNVRRSRRGGEYIVNVGGILKVPVGNNVTVDVIFYEYLHNEYRRSFVELHFKACDLILHDSYLGLLLRRAGLVKCPISPGKLVFKNITLNLDIPSVWPFEKCKGEATAIDSTNGAIMGIWHVIVTVKEN